MSSRGAINKIPKTIIFIDKIDNTLNIVNTYNQNFLGRFKIIETWLKKLFVSL